MLTLCQSGDATETAFVRFLDSLDRARYGCSFLHDAIEI